MATVNHQMQTDQARHELKSFGFEERYIDRALEVYQTSPDILGVSYDTAALTEIILKLQEKDVCENKNKNKMKNNKKNGCVADAFHSRYLTPLLLGSLAEDELVDYRHDDGKFSVCTITKLRRNAATLTLRDQANDAIFKNINYMKEAHRFCKAFSISHAPRSTTHGNLSNLSNLSLLSINDFVDVNPILNMSNGTYLGWRIGEIKELCKNSGQCKIEFQHDNQMNTFWTHFDNSNEIATFTSKTNQTIASLSNASSAPIAPIAPNSNNIVNNNNNNANHLFLNSFQNYNTYENTPVTDEVKIRDESEILRTMQMIDSVWDGSLPALPAASQVPAACPTKEEKLPQLQKGTTASKSYKMPPRRRSRLSRISTPSANKSNKSKHVANGSKSISSVCSNSSSGTGAAATAAATAPKRVDSGADPFAKLMKPFRTSASKKLKKNGKSSSYNSLPEFAPCLSMNECANLSVGDKIDHRMRTGQFGSAVIKRKLDGTWLQISYDGFDATFDTFCNYRVERNRFASLNSVSKRKKHRLLDLKVGDFVDVRPIWMNCFYPNDAPSIGWVFGEIIQFDHKSGQVQVSYGVNNCMLSFWTHCDNVHEISYFNTKTTQFGRDGRDGRDGTSANSGVNGMNGINRKQWDESKEQICESAGETGGMGGTSGTSGRECIVCMDSEANMVCIPCGHLMICESCSEDVCNSEEQKGKCLYCLKKVEKIIKVYTS